MKTNPVASVLDRNLTVAAAQAETDKFVPIVEEAVNFGTTVYASVKPIVPSDMPQENDVPLLMYLHLLEMADGVAELLRKGCVGATMPLTRTMFEAVLSLEYLLKDDFSRRARAWMYTYALEQLRSCKIALGEDPEFVDAIADDVAASQVDLSPAVRIAQTQKQTWIDYLNRPEFVEIATEYNSKGRYPKWHYLFGGPKSVAGLAKHLKRHAQYMVFYGYWSGVDHGTNPRRFEARTKSKDKVVRLVRDSAYMGSVGRVTAKLLHQASLFIVRQYRPSAESDVQKWWQQLQPELGA